MERFIVDEHGRRTAVILDVEDYRALVRAAEDAGDIQAVDDAHRQIDSGEDELIDFREARKEWQRPRNSGKDEPDK